LPARTSECENEPNRTDNKETTKHVNTKPRRRSHFDDPVPTCVKMQRNASKCDSTTAKMAERSQKSPASRRGRAYSRRRGFFLFIGNRIRGGASTLCGGVDGCIHSAGPDPSSHCCGLRPG
jgi:hypothetical protein